MSETQPQQSSVLAATSQIAALVGAAITALGGAIVATGLVDQAIVTEYVAWILGGIPILVTVWTQLVVRVVPSLGAKTTAFIDKDGFVRLEQTEGRIGELTRTIEQLVKEVKDLRALSSEAGIGGAPSERA